MSRFSPMEELMLRKSKLLATGILVSSLLSCANQPPSPPAPQAETGAQSTHNRASMRVVDDAGKQAGALIASNKDFVQGDGLKPPTDSPNSGPKGLVMPDSSKSNISFDKIHTDEEFDSVLSNGQPHTVLVILKDSFQARVRTKIGGIESLKGDKHLSFASGLSHEESQLSHIFSKYKVESFNSRLNDPSDADIAKYAQEELATESELGIDSPNEFSWLYVTLADFSAPTAKEFVHELQKLPFVREVNFVPEVKVAAVTYRQPPTTEPALPQASGSFTWQQNDYGSDGWWWNRHSIGAAWDYNKGANSSGTRIKVAVIDRHVKTYS